MGFLVVKASLLVLGLLGSSLGKLHVNSQAIKLAEQVKIYIQNSRPTSSFVTCNVFLLSDDDSCEDVWTDFVKESKCAKYIFSSINATQMHDTYTTVTLLVIQSQAEFKTNFQLFLRSTYFMNRGKYQFAFCSPLSNIAWVWNTSKEIWSNRILNFVLLYSNVTLKVASYNPFKNQLQIMNAIEKTNPGFPDALRDMQGYPFKVMEIPRYVDFDLEYSYSFDTNYVNALQKCFNLTITKVLITKDQSTLNNLFHRLTVEDIELVPFTETVGFYEIPKKYSKSVTYLNPYTMNNVVAIVPNPKQKSQWYFFFTMLLTVVIPLGVSFSSMMASLDKYASSSSKKTQTDFMGFLALCLKSSLPHFAKQISVLKSVWLLGSILNAIVYDLLALDFALVPRYEKAIDSLSDLRSANLPIFSIDLVLPPHYNVTKLSKTAWRNKIQENQGNAAFIGLHETFDKIAKWHANTRRPYNYRMLKEVVVPAYGAFLSKTKTPYFYELEQLILRVKQFGATVEVPYRYKPEQLTRESNQFLVFKDFFGIFAVWMTGMCAGSLLLVLEIVYYAFEEMKKKCWVWKAMF